LSLFLIIKKKKMPETLTNKQLLEEIRAEQRVNADIMFKNAQIVSNFINRQESLNTKWSLYLETNATSEGAISKLERLEGTVVEMKNSIDKKIAYFTGAGFVVITAGKWLISKLMI